MFRRRLSTEMNHVKVARGISTPAPSKMIFARSPNRTCGLLEASTACSTRSVPERFNVGSIMLGSCARASEHQALIAAFQSVMGTQRSFST